MSVFFRGTPKAVLSRLSALLVDQSFCDDIQGLALVQDAIREVEAGAWLVNINGFALEVVEPPMTVEQDVYGCRAGRGCTDVAEELRPEFEKMIADRVATGIGVDDRHFHWVHRIDASEHPTRDVGTLVARTLGSSLVAEAARVLLDQVRLIAGPGCVDVHVTLMPDHVRVRLDDDCGLGGTDRPEAALAASGADGQGDALGFLTDHASGWGIVGGRSARSIWADFPRSAGDAAYLARNYRLVPAARIPAGAYVYRGTEHLAWVEIQAPKVAGNTVYLTGVDQRGLATKRTTEMVPVFAPGPATAELEG